MEALAALTLRKETANQSRGLYCILNDDDDDDDDDEHRLVRLCIYRAVFVCWSA